MPATSCVRVGVIMAGGSGERFWPVSRRHRPKQLLRLTNERETMLEEAVHRLEPLIPADHIYVVTGEHLVKPIQDAGVGIPHENVIAEPCKRNTAGCLAFAAAHMLAKYGKDASEISMAIVTADHQIGDPERFQETVRVALETAEETGALVTHGVVPTRPDTGFGYIQAAMGDKAAREANTIPVYKVAAFHEKPNREKAEEFIATGKYFWNSGMFFWRLDSFFRELDTANPDLANATRDMADAMRANDKGTVRRIFDALDNISIDYALMEHAKHVMVTRADYPWDDVGAWTSLDRSRHPDDDGNVVEGDPVIIDCKDCIIYNDAGPDQMAVSVVGVEDLVVVVSKDGVLVIPKDRAQDVRHAVAELKARGSRHV